jgi:hypothetical protein
MMCPILIQMWCFHVKQGAAQLKKKIYTDTSTQSRTREGLTEKKNTETMI